MLTLTVNAARIGTELSHQGCGTHARGAERCRVSDAAVLTQVHEVRYDKQEAFHSVAKVMDLKVGLAPPHTKRATSS